MANVALNILLGLVDKARPGLQATEKQLRGLKEESAKATADIQEKWGASAQAARRAGTVMVAAGAAGIGALTALAAKASNFGSEISDMAARTGTSAEELTALKYAAEQTGASLDTVEKGLRIVSRAAYDATQGSKESEDAFKYLGVQVTDTSGKLKDPAVLFREVGEALRNTEDPALRSALAMKTLGRGGTELLPMFTDVNKSLTQFMDDAKALGLTIDDDLAGKLDAADDTLQRFKASTSAAFLQLGAVAAPVLASVANLLTQVTVRVTHFAQQHPLLTKMGVAGAAALFAILIPLGILLMTLPTVVSGISILRGAFAAESLAALGAKLATLEMAVATRAAGIAALWSAGGFAALGTAIWAAIAPALPILALVLIVLAAIAKAIDYIKGRTEGETFSGWLKWAKSGGGLATPEEATGSTGISPTSAAAGSTPSIEDIQAQAQEIADTTATKVAAVGIGAGAGATAGGGSINIEMPINVDARGAVDPAAVETAATRAIEAATPVIDNRIRTMLSQYRLIPAGY